MLRKSLVLLVVGTVIFFLCSASSADVPHMINYQGKLTTASGGCLNDTVQMTFTIYADSFGTSADWTETQTEVIVKEGVFSVLLGAVDTIPSAVFDGNIKYLGVQVESDPEMRPLKPMVSVAYAYRAGTADGGGGVTDHGELEGLLDDDHPQYVLIPGDGTRNVNVKFGDNTMVVCSSKVVIGSHSCDEYERTPLLRILRDIETDEGMFCGIDLDIDNWVGTADLRGVNSYVESYNGAATGVDGHATCNNPSTAVGVHGEANGGINAYGIVGNAYNASNHNYAGKFYGDVDIDGNLSKSGGSFRIDHPLDPENKYLQHSFVESPDMMNIYNGNVVLDAEGRATVELPEYFEAVNRDFRYQLTCIGGYAPVYVSEEISGNTFTIAGGVPSMKVSWQVTGVRQDKWAEANRIQVIVDKKPNEKGLYRHPELYGLGLEKRSDHDLLENMEEESNEE